MRKPERQQDSSEFLAAGQCDWPESGVGAVDSLCGQLGYGPSVPHRSESVFRAPVPFHRFILSRRSGRGRGADPSLEDRRESEDHRRHPARRQHDPRGSFRRAGLS